MTLGLAVGVTAAVVVACTAAAYVYSKHHFRVLLDDARAGALAQGELIRVALEHQMIENDRTLIARMIESFRRRRGSNRSPFSTAAASSASIPARTPAPARIAPRSPAGLSGNSRRHRNARRRFLRTVCPSAIVRRATAATIRRRRSMVFSFSTTTPVRCASLTRDLRRMVAGPP